MKRASRKRGPDKGAADYVSEFNLQNHIPSPDTPSPSQIDNVKKKYTSMLDSETNEVKSGFARRDFINICQELADVVYVCYGAASELGVPLDAVIEVIHDWNLEKPGVRRADGKVLKSPDSQSDDLRRKIYRVLREHGYDPNID